MREGRAFAWAITALWGVACASPLGYNFTGPVSPYYLTVGNGIAVIQGTRVLRIIPFAYDGWTSEGVFAVSGAIAGEGTIRTRASESPSDGRDKGGTYTLDGQPKGVEYSSPPAGYGRWYDGTTDGTRNYFTDHRGGVYSSNFYWQNPRLLFDLSDVCASAPEYDSDCNFGGSISGIAYDPYRNSLWISSVPDPSIREYSLTGRLLGQIHAYPMGNAALAFDPADRTLWLASRDGFLQQWSTDGHLLQTAPLEQIDRRFQGLYLYNGAEFQMLAPEPNIPAPMPEPATVALFAGGFALLAALSRRRSRQLGN